MSLFDAAIILLAGIAAGIINVVAGAGTLNTFPTLLALGFSPVTANVSNTVGLVPGSIAGAFGYRRDLTGQWRSVMRMASLSVIGGLVGAVLLLMLPLRRLRYGGPASMWGFAIHRASHEDYEDSYLPDGSTAGTPEDGFDTACGLYLADPTAWT